MYKITLIAMFFSVAAFFSCQKETYQVDAEIKDHTANLAHSWVLKKVVQSDAKAGPGKLKQLEITSAVVTGDASEISFSDDTYTATGYIQEIFGQSGNWSLDNPNFPTAIKIENTTGTRSVPLGRSVLEFSNELHIRNDVYNCRDNTLATSYIFIFEKK